MKKHPHGFTAIELAIVVGVIIILASLIWPSFVSVRNKARKTLCASNLNQIYHGLTMYSLDNSRDGEIFPASMTNLLTGSQVFGKAADGSTLVERTSDAYVSDERIFVCPMDYTKASAKVVLPDGTTNWTLKPVNLLSTPPAPVDPFSTMAERLGNSDPYLPNQRNSSYKYEFSGKICETYTPDPVNGASWDGSNWQGPGSYPYTTLCENYLVPKDDPQETGVLFATGPAPEEVDRYGYVMAKDPGTGDILTVGVSYADFKFHQLNYGDIYICGVATAVPGTDYPAPPVSGVDANGNSIAFEDPIDWYNDPLFPATTDEFGNITNIIANYSRSWLPVVRCFWHVGSNHIDSDNFEEVQNVSLDGLIFDSEPYWERTAFKYGAKTGDGVVQ